MRPPPRVISAALLEDKDLNLWLWFEFAVLLSLVVAGVAFPALPRSHVAIPALCVVVSAGCLYLSALALWVRHYAGSCPPAPPSPPAS